METKSISRAAEVLNSTQPTISRQIAAMEDAIGFRLFERKGGSRIVPTDSGRQFFSEIEGVLLGLEDLPGIAKGVSSFKKQCIRVIATMPLLFSNQFVNAFRKFATENPHIQLRINMSYRDQIEATVAGGQADIGFAALPITHPALDSKELISTCPVAVASNEHNFKTNQLLEIANLLDENLILNQGKPIGQYSNLSSENWPSSIPTQIDTKHAHLAIRMVEEGLGVTICDPLSALAFGNTRIKIIPLKTNLQIVFGYMFSKIHNLMPELSGLIELIEVSTNSLKDNLQNITTIK